MKDKILCALKANVLNAKSISSDGFYLNNTSFTFIDIKREKQYKEVLVVTQHKTWWRGEYQKTKTEEKESGYTYCVGAYGKKYDITKKEFDEILIHRKKEVKKDQENKLDSLCKK